MLLQGICEGKAQTVAYLRSVLELMGLTLISIHHGQGGNEHGGAYEEASASAELRSVRRDWRDGWQRVDVLASYVQSPHLQPLLRKRALLLP